MKKINNSYFQSFYSSLARKFRIAKSAEPVNILITIDTVMNRFQRSFLYLSEALGRSFCLKMERHSSNLNQKLPQLEVY